MLGTYMLSWLKSNEIQMTETLKNFKRRVEKRTPFYGKFYLNSLRYFALLYLSVYLSPM